ncbi:MAG: HD domain-containing protein [Lentisphaeria bacterium]|jgi:hypothetical protein
MEPVRREELIAAMTATFGADSRRIRHALAVLDYAEQLLAAEPGDPATVTAAALLHDIGIPAAERQHGSAAPRFQELEGPPIARAILERLGVAPAVTAHVCRIVGSHHSAGDIDTPEFRIVWDADWLVNLPEEHGELPPARRQALADRVFRTATGRRLAAAYLAGAPPTPSAEPQP